MAEPTLGVLGGSGLYDLPGLEGVERLAVDTPFGAPSDELVIGRLGGTRLVFLPRHGRGHRLLPTEINFRANIFALKRIGVEWIVAVSAVGSLRAEIAPGHVVVPDQFIDRTRLRPSTFFGRGVVAHVQFADPVCPTLSRVLAEAARAAGAGAAPGEAPLSAITVVGSVAFDTIETPLGRAEEVLGGSATYFAVAASFFAPVSLVAVVGDDFPEAERDHLASHGIDLSGLEVRPGRTFRWSGRYHEDMNVRDTLALELNVFA